MGADQHVSAPGSILHTLRLGACFWKQGYIQVCMRMDTDPCGTALRLPAMHSEFRAVIATNSYAADGDWHACSHLNCTILQCALLQGGPQVLTRPVTGWFLTQSTCVHVGHHDA